MKACLNQILHAVKDLLHERIVIFEVGYMRPPQIHVQQERILRLKLAFEELGPKRPLNAWNHFVLPRRQFGSKKFAALHLIGLLCLPFVSREQMAAFEQTMGSFPYPVVSITPAASMLAK